MDSVWQKALKLWLKTKILKCWQVLLILMQFPGKIISFIINTVCLYRFQPGLSILESRQNEGEEVYVFFQFIILILQNPLGN